MTHIEVQTIIAHYIKGLKNRNILLTINVLKLGIYANGVAIRLETHGESAGSHIRQFWATLEICCDLKILTTRPIPADLAAKAESQKRRIPVCFASKTPSHSTTNFHI